MEKSVQKHEWLGYAIGILLAELVGAVSGLFAGADGAFYGTLQKPPLAPPGWLFPVMWTLLYALMGAASYRVWREGEAAGRTAALAVYAVQLAVNFLWPIVFFRFEAVGPAFAVLVLLCVLVAITMVLFRRVDKAASLLLVPYFLWSVFAAYLNAGIYLLNIQ